MIMTEKMELEIENIESILADNSLTDAQKIQYIVKVHQHNRQLMHFIEGISHKK